MEGASSQRPACRDHLPPSTAGRGKTWGAQPGSSQTTGRTAPPARRTPAKGCHPSASQRAATACPLSRRPKGTLGRTADPFPGAVCQTSAGVREVLLPADTACSDHLPSSPRPEGPGAHNRVETTPAPSARQAPGVRDAIPRWVSVQRPRAPSAPGRGEPWGAQPTHHPKPRGARRRLPERRRGARGATSRRSGAQRPSAHQPEASGTRGARPTRSLQTDEARRRLPDRRRVGGMLFLRGPACRDHVPPQPLAGENLGAHNWTTTMMGTSRYPTPPARQAPGLRGATSQWAGVQRPPASSAAGRGGPGAHNQPNRNLPATHPRTISPNLTTHSNTIQPDPREGASIQAAPRAPAEQPGERVLLGL